jgi:hypothetical protein
MVYEPTAKTIRPDGRGSAAKRAGIVLIAYAPNHHEQRR